MRVGFIGLGSQGGPIAERVANSGTVETVVWARRAETLVPFQDGPARIAASPAELGEGLDLLVTCVFDAEGTREVLFGAGGAAHAMPRGATIMCHSTVSPQEIVDIATEAAELGLRVLDAPVSGGGWKAAAGELVVMVGGDEAAYREILPVIETYSNLTVHLGPVGAGQQAKLLNNTVLAAHIALADDIYAIAAELGLDQAGLGRILVNSSGRSYGLEIYSGVGSLAPLARTPIRPTLTKDVNLLSGVIDGLKAGSVLLPPARTFVTELDRIAGESA